MEKHYKLQNGTELHIFTNDESSFMVTATLIIKNGKALLVGSGFKQSEGERIVRYLQDAQLTLEKIFIIQGDPDYYFALEPIKKSFPEAIVYATSYVIDHILKTVSKKLQVWGGHAIRMKTFFSPFVPGNNCFKLSIYLYTSTLSSMSK